MSLGHKLRTAIANFLMADQQVNSAPQNEAARRVMEHNRSVARAKFEKVQKRATRARRQKQLLDLRLGI